MAEYKRKFYVVYKALVLKTNLQITIGFYVFSVSLAMLHKLQCVCSLKRDWHIGTRMILNRPDGCVCIHKNDENKMKLSSSFCRVVDHITGAIIGTGRKRLNEKFMFCKILVFC